MKKIISVLLSVLLIFPISVNCFAVNNGISYYVDSVDGNDNNDGTGINSAWKTIGKASQHTFNPGDKLLFKAGGIYSGNFEAKGSGSETEPVYVGAYGDIENDGMPIITSLQDVVLFSVGNVSNWKIENIEFTAPNGQGVYITADNNNVVKNITVENCVFHDISNKELVTRYSILLSSSGEFSRLNNITIKNCNIYDCGYGIAMGGLTREWTPDYFVSPQESYNRDYTIDGVSLNNILYDAIIITSVYGMVIRNCSLINTCLKDDHYTAPMWSHHASNFVIENCEIAGALNEKDGMAVDFDGWTTDATYQYIYSHDNVRFIRNCCYDNKTCNDNCTVRYCLSVNDNKGENSMCQLLTSGSVKYSEDEYPVKMTNFKFYNNTVINSSEIYMIGLENAYIVNNIFTGDMTSSFLFSRKSKDDSGNSIIYKFDGTMTNNCFYGTGVPYIAKNNYVCNPGFCGDDETNINSYKLSEKSALLGKGIKVEDDMGEYDIYGNALTDSINIGCYGGNGEKTDFTVSAFDNLKALVNTVLGSIYNFIYICNDTFWLF